MMIPKFFLLSQTELEMIHNTALKILETVGMKADGKQAIKIYQSAGAKVEEDNIVKFPPSMIQKAIETCNPRFSLYHRNTNEELVLGDSITKHCPSGWTSVILDWKTAKYREAIQSDMIDSVKMCGALDEINCFMAPLICSDVKASEMELYQFKVGVEYSNKPMILSASDGKTVEKIIYLGSISAGGKEQLAERPTFAINIGIMSPLLLTSDLCDIIITCANLGVPLCLFSDSSAGATSPVTLSGTLAGSHSEILSAITLAKLVNPEANILYTSYSKAFDMQYADVLVGSPEYGLLRAATVQLGKYIGLPTGGGMLLADSPKLDMQAGIEKMGSSFLMMLSGADLSIGMGLLSKLMIFSIESLVIDAEAVAYFNRILEGINCDDDHLAVEVYQKVKPAGEFLTTKHTLDFFKSEFWNSKIAYRDSFSSWNASGKNISMESKVKDFIEKTLQEYESPGLPDEFINEFEEIKSE